VCELKDIDSENVKSTPQFVFYTYRTHTLQIWLTELMWIYT